jgi:hypothetical protein
MSDYLIVSQVARELTQSLGREVRPHDISTLFYGRQLSDDRCPIVGGRRMIPRDYLPEIGRVLRNRKKKLRSTT